MNRGTLRGLTQAAQPLYRTGLYSTIGTAALYPNQWFFATDDPVASTGTLYYSDGSTWTRISATKTEIARAAITSNGPSSTGTTVTDITGLSISFTLATARAVRLDLNIPLMVNDTADNTSIYLTDSSNTILQQTNIPTAAVSAAVPMGNPPCWTVLDLAAGSYTYKARQSTGVGHTIHTVSDVTAPAFLEAVAM